MFKKQLMKPLTRQTIEFPGILKDYTQSISVLQKLNAKGFISAKLPVRLAINFGKKSIIDRTTISSL